MPEIKHGTVNAYNNHGCRCEACKAANAAAVKAYRAKLKAALREAERTAA
jgi:hypothetical protein